MALKVEQECDWCQDRKSVALKVTEGKVDLNVPLPEGWERKSPFPGGRVGPPDGMDLCTVCRDNYDKVIRNAQMAHDQVLEQAVRSAQSDRRKGVTGGAKKQTSALFAAKA
jgi:hypothetical protein